MSDDDDDASLKFLSLWHGEMCLDDTADLLPAIDGQSKYDWHPESLKLMKSMQTGPENFEDTEGDDGGE